MRMLQTAAMSAALSGLLLIPISGAAAQTATPAAAYSCATAMIGSPAAGMLGEGEMHEMAATDPGTPTVGVDHLAMEIDQMYIDMMIPHHQSIIALAEAALPRLQDERLREIAQAVITAQQPEIDELRALRDAFYGDPEPMPMDRAMMDAMMEMMEMMPGMSGTMDEMASQMTSDEMASQMASQMNAETQVAAFCAAANPDLAFIDLTIPHHQMAIDSSEVVLDQAEHPEIRDVAQRVIDAQQQEIETLAEIRAELTGEATPATP